MKCPHCKHENPPWARFCGRCVVRLASICCSSCGASNPSENKFCWQCAAPLGETSEPSWGLRHGLRGESRAIAAVRERVADFVARRGTERPPPPILLQGEAGAGKSLMARLMRRLGSRASGPFVAVELASIPPALVEAGLFGEVRKRSAHPRPGLFHAADGGMIFLGLTVAFPRSIGETVSDRAILRVWTYVDMWTRCERVVGRCRIRAPAVRARVLDGRSAHWRDSTSFSLL